MLWLFLAITTLGLILLALGLRGKVVGDSPHCRKCKFDLTGLDRETPEAVCPECAAKLAEDGAVRSGLRRRRKRLIYLSVILLLPILGLLIASPSWTAWNSSKPTQVLLLDGRLGSPRVRDAAIVELLKRQDADTLTVAQNRGTFRLIAHRISQGNPVDLTHAARLARGRAKGQVDEKDWDEVIESARDLTESWWIDSIDFPAGHILVRDAQSRIVGEEPLPKFIDRSPFTVGSVCFLIRLEEVTIDGEPLTLIDNGAWMEKRYPGFGWGDAPRIRYKVSGDRFSISSRVQMQIEDSPDGVLGAITPQQQGGDAWDQIPVADNTFWLGSIELGEHQMQARWSIEAFASDEFHRNTKISQPELKAVLGLGNFELQTQSTLSIVESSRDMLELVQDEARLEKAKEFLGIRGVELRDHDKPSGYILNILLNEYALLEDSAMVGRLEVEIEGKRFGSQKQYAISKRPIQDVHVGTGFALSVIAGVDIGEGATSCTVLFVPDLDEAVLVAGPWMTEHGTPMPTVATEIRWENVPITILNPDDD